MLSAMGLPGGGVVSVGNSHVLVRPGQVPSPTALMMGPRAMSNAGVREGEAVDAKRAVLPHATQVQIQGDELPVKPQALLRALHGLPVSSGDVISIEPAYTDGDTAVEITIQSVEPPSAGTVGPGTSVAAAGQVVAMATSGARAHTVVEIDNDAPTRAEALLAGLESELDLLTGWFSLFASPGNLPSAWGLPQIAGVIVEAPPGCGRVELVEAAANAAGAHLHTVSVNLVFKPARLLDLLETAVKTSPTPGVVFVDRLEAVAGEEGLTPFRTQVGAIIRWFLDAVSERPGLATVLGVGSAASLDTTITKSPLLPRTLSIPPPDLNRRALLFEAALARIPSEDVDFDALAARTAGFSGSDILASVVHGSAKIVRSGDKLNQEILVSAVQETTPSLGAAAMGEIPSYGFEKVAGLEDVKQRLTEAVIWPMTVPERFERLGIEPPRGILLYGPPGTGKTFVVRALAHESGAAFFPIKGAELLDKFVGESERGVREVFARARAAAPAILFFDEIDSLAPVRGSSTTSVTDSVVAALLTELDGIGERGDIVVIGATNRRDLVDPALLRSGRLETHIELGLPGVDGRRALLNIVDIPFAEGVDLDELARMSDGLSFADLTGMLREAALIVLRTDQTELTVGWDEINQALERFEERQNNS